MSDTPTKEKDQFEEEAGSIEAELSKKLSEKMIKILKRLAYEVSIVGLSEEEACMVVNFDYAQLLSLKEKNKLVERMFQIKQLEYKRGLLKTLSERARNGDEKLAQWLLEAKYSEEFNKRKGAGKGEGGGNDLLGAAVEFIQKTTEGGLVKETSGRAVIVGGGMNDGKPLPNPHEMLKGRVAKVIKQIEKDNGQV